MHNFRQFIAAALTAVVALQGGAATVGEDIRTADNRVVYEVFVRNFSNSSRLSAVTNAIPRLKSLGVDVIWLMPIYKGGDKDRWSTYSSPYAVKDYYQIDPLHGTDADLHTLVAEAHAAGMEVWLDWVANHTSTDAVWTTSHPEYYGSTFKHPSGWSDVYQLDYNNADLRAAMIDAIKYWVNEFDIDGYRCDYSDGVPRDFWRQARAAVNEIKPITWLAESGGDGNNSLQVKETFDYNYAWAFNDALISAGTTNDCADKVASAIYLLYNCRDAANYEGKSRMVYLTNHDVVQDKGGSPDRHFGNNLELMTVVEFTAFGMPLIYNGQEIKWSTGQVLLAEKSVINWNGGSKAITELITSLTDLKHRATALNAGPTGGCFIHHPTGVDSEVLVYERRKGNESVVVMINYAATASTFTVATLPEAGYSEWFTSSEADFASSKEFTLPAKGYAIWVKNDEKEIEPKSHHIYVEDLTGWSSLNIYGWVSGNYSEIFGSWPGLKPSRTETLADGITYKVWDIPETWWGQTYNLIFNCSSSQIADFSFPLNRDICLTVTASGLKEKTLPAGVDDVIADSDVNVAPVYYDLQGIRVEHLTPGRIYIERRGANVTKRIFQ